MTEPSPTELDDTNVVLHLFSPDVAADPHPVYRQMLDRCPVAKGDFGGTEGVLLSRYDDVLFALRHPESFTNEMGLGLGDQPLLPLEVDPPVHTGYRRLLNPQFVPREIEKLAPDVRKRVVELLDGFAGRGSCDFHQEFATPLPSGIFITLMGLPEADLPQFYEWRDNTIRPDVEPGDLEGAARIRRETGHAISEYFKERIAERRAEPDDSLLSRIVHAEIDGRRLDEVELLGISHLLLLGGLDTVTATLDCMIEYLATHPEQRQRLVDDPSCIPGAVEELLRWLTPVMVVPRAAAQDVTIDGVEIKKGASVTLVLGAANEDVAQFETDVVDFDREPNKHLAFGGGHHLCLGAHLARMELRIALEELHARIPDYRLADGAEIGFSTGIRQADSLPLVWRSPATQAASGRSSAGAPSLATDA